jgi:hypothetical protein
MSRGGLSEGFRRCVRRRADDVVTLGYHNLRCLNRGSLAALSGTTPTPGLRPGSRGVESHLPVIGSSGAHPRARLRADSAEISAMASVRGNNRHQLPQLK